MQHKLTDDFNRKYERLFFDHLDKVIKADTITLELTKSRKDSILAQTETYLSTLPVSPQTLSDLYQHFLTMNKITDHTPLPVLQAKLPSITTNPKTQPTTTSSNTTLGKRQREEEHPNSSKYFLLQGPRPPLQPS